MSNHENSTTAFPGTQYATGISPSGHSAGMTLRDYFAAKAMQSIVQIEYPSAFSIQCVASDAYAIADAMLKEREK